MISGQSLLDLVSAGVSSYPPNYEFPVGGSNQGITPPELDSLQAICLCLPVCRATIEQVTQLVTLQMAYDIAILGVRGAVHAAHSNGRHLLDASLVCLTLDKNQLDWRDVLRALAIIERCCQEVDVDFDALARSAASVADGRRQSLIHEYLLREPAMRTTKAMGFEAHGNGGDLRFDRCL